MNLNIAEWLGKLTGSKWGLVALGAIFTVGVGAEAIDAQSEAAQTGGKGLVVACGVIAVAAVSKIAARFGNKGSEQPKQ